jgi:hypothetical protein
VSGLDPKGEPILTLAAAGMAVLRTVLNHPCQSETSWSGPESEKAVKLCKWLMKDPTNDHVYVMRPDRLAWLLIAAVALAASACGHALELTLENLQLFGDGRAAYAHPAQLFELEMAGTLFVIAAVTIGRRLAARAMHARAGEDCLSPALDGVCRMGLVRCAAMLLSVQFAALIASEILEQRLSGSAVGIASILGIGHMTAIVVHTVVGVLFAWMLYRLARFVHDQTAALVGAIARFARHISQPPALAATSYSRIHLWTSVRRPPVLALGLANRPPPVHRTYRLGT